jgi:hypothetical protein
MKAGEQGGRTGSVETFIVIEDSAFQNSTTPLRFRAY